MTDPMTENEHARHLDILCDLITYAKRQGWPIHVNVRQAATLRRHGLWDDAVHREYRDIAERALATTETT
jgi:hypothetical protein